MLEGKNYRITAKNIWCHEMIGLGVVAKSAGKTVEGKVVDEKKNVFIIEDKGDEKMAAKKGTEFEFILGQEKVSVMGNDIMYAPEQRAKALLRFCR